MRPFFCLSFLIVTVSLVFAAPLDARGGKGGGKGGGGGNGWAKGHGHGGGGPQWNRQQWQSGGGQRVAEHGQKPNHWDKHQFADKPAKPDKDKEFDKHERSTFANDPTNSATEAYNKKQKQLAIEQRNRDKRISQAEHLREIGERTGNQNLIDNADRMEAFAHDHYARRVSHLEKFGVTDPLLNPGNGINDSLLPGTDGLVDPLGEVGLLDWLPFFP